MMRRLLPVLLLVSAVAFFPSFSGVAADPFPTFDTPSMLTAKSLGAAMLAVTRAGERLVAVGERGIVLLSDDSGRSWRQVDAPVRVSLTAVTFVGEKKAGPWVTSV